MGMLALKEGWDQGQKVQKGVLSGDYADKISSGWDKFSGGVSDKYNQAGAAMSRLPIYASDLASGSSTLTGMGQLPAQGMDLYGGTTGARWDLLSGAQPANSGISGFSVQSAPMFEAGNMIPGGSEMLGASHNFAMPVDQLALEGSTTLGVGGQAAEIGDAGAGLQGGGSTPYLAYANIAKDLLTGEGGDKITGDPYADAALRTGAAYLTFGLSEIPYAFF
jgi:hypothetical protein